MLERCLNLVLFSFRNETAFSFHRLLNSRSESLTLKRPSMKNDVDISQVNELENLLKSIGKDKAVDYSVVTVDDEILPVNGTNDDSNGLESNHDVRYVVFMCISIILFTFGCVTNLAVIIRLIRQGVLRARIRMLLFSLSIADFLYIILEFPLNQFVWLSTVYWTTGVVTCRMSAYARGFSAYLIAYILVVVSLDRCLNTVRPVTPKDACKRMKKLLATAVVGASICALPQIGIFHLADVPGVGNKKQCVSKGLVDPDDSFSGAVYPLFTFICLYVVPLVLISMSYTIILYSMSRPVSNGECSQIISFRASSGSSNDKTTIRTRAKSVNNEAFIRKAQIKTLRILLTTVVAFFLCWLPYYMTLLFYVCNRELATRIIPFEVYKIAELSAVSNACINPFIYGNYLLKIKQRCWCWRKR